MWARFRPTSVGTTVSVDPMGMLIGGPLPPAWGQPKLRKQRLSFRTAHPHQRGDNLCTMMPAKPVAHTPTQDLPDLWHDLENHLNDVAERARTYAEKIGAGELGYYTGLWHDLGKYNPEFQVYLQRCHQMKQAGIQKKTRGPAHAIHGAVLAHELKCTPLSFLIDGHHAGLPNQIELKNKFKDSGWHKTYALVRQQADLYLPQLKPDQDLRTYFQPFGKDKLAVEVFLRLLFSCLIDADRLDTERFANPEQYSLRQQRSTEISIDQLWSTFDQQQQEFVKAAQEPESPVNQVRAEVYQKCLDAAEFDPGVFRLCVPTGGGKTRSGLAFALKHAKLKHKQRVIFAVPYTSIIEQTASVYREIFAELGDAAVLEHHSAIQNDRAPSQPNTDLEVEEVSNETLVQAKLATQNWDAKLIVTTTVQLFESLFSNKPSKCRKLHNIVNSVIVLDEVQTLPIALLSPILSILKELVDRYQVTVVLCTATQPALEGNTPYFKDGFLLDSVRDIILPTLATEHFHTLKRVQYEIPQPGKTLTWQQLANEIVLDQSALVVLNTRRDALSVLDALDVNPDISGDLPDEQVQSILQSAPVLHLSTLLCGAHRRVVLAEVRRRLKDKQSCILVSTQVVEAGVDLDFPVVYRAVGPLDRIVQAAGRCNREGKLNKIGQLGRVILFEPAEGSQPPPGDYAKAMKKSRDTLQGEGFQESQLHEPEIFQQYFRSLYPLTANTKGELDGKGIQDLRQSWSFREVGENFRLIEENTVPVVIVYNTEVRALLKAIEHRGLWASDRAKLQPYMVNLPHYVFQKAETTAEVKPGLNLWAWTGEYNPIRGIPYESSIVLDPGFLVG